MKKPSILFALPGLHLVPRGAEVAFESVATGLAESGDFDVRVVGAGDALPDRPYSYQKVTMVARERFERWPKFPPFRSEFRWEEVTFAMNLRSALKNSQADLTVTCSYPFVSWVLRGVRSASGEKSRHIFVTQNGDHPALRIKSEYKLFRCDGLVCTNPVFFERNRRTWNAALIPNGVDTARFQPGPGERESFGLPADKPIVTMVSALIPSKRVEIGVRAVAALPDAVLALAGDGPQREAVDTLARDLLPGRYFRSVIAGDRMPAFYRSGDVFLHLSREESFGNVYIEAMACGLPVVADDYPTSRWILGDKARLVDTTEAATVSCALRDALSSGRSDAPGLYAIVKSRFSWPVVIEEYARFFRSLFASPPPQHTD